MKPLVSIALCTCNGAAYLRPLLDSLLAQTYMPLELVVVDDASTDETPALLATYADRPQVRLYQNEVRLGYVRNFERAIGLCRGDYIALADQDDRWLPNKVARLLGALGDCSLVYSDSRLVNADGQPTGQCAANFKRPIAGHDPRPFWYDNCVSGHALLFRRALLAVALPFPRGVYHDWWLAGVAATTGGIAYTPQCLVEHRLHAGNQTDLARRRKKAGPSEGRRVRQRRAHAERLRRLRAFARLESPHQPLLRRLLAEEQARIGGFNFRLLALRWQHRHTLYQISNKKSLKHLSQLKNDCKGIPARR